MIIKHTPWEKRNLGVESSVEYYIDADDTLYDIKEIECALQDYQVAHVATGNVNALYYLQSHGFRFIEANIQLKRDLDSIELPGIYKRYEHVISHRYAECSEIEEIISQVRTGSIFKTDKIALDPCFGVEYAGRRYALWSEDIIEQGGIVVLSLYKETPIGFEIYTENDRKCTNYIGGVFPEFENKGLGFAPLYSELLNQKERGNKSVITGVSSNNPPVLKLHEMLGYKVESMGYLLIKHTGRL